MRVMLVGKGGRESALAWAMGKSPLVDDVLIETGSDIDEIVSRALEERADWVMIGPEVPLVAGLVDRLEEVGIPAFGPSAAAAQLEGSKIFMKELCTEHSIPTAPYRVADNIDEALALIFDWDNVPVVKADGLCGGKGVVVTNSFVEAGEAAQAMFRGDAPYGAAGKRIVIEDRLCEERECSMMFLCQDEVAIPIPPARDYKRIGDGDTGPNTGGMGAYSPLPDVDDALVEDVRKRIILPTLRAMQAQGRPFRGLLYAGLMLTQEGPMLLEFNVRFGDPETQVVLPRLESDIVPYLLAIARNEPGGLARLGPLAVSPNAAVCKVLASSDYPGDYEEDKLITDLGYLPNTLIFDAGVRIDENGTQFTAGGRVMGVVGLGSTIEIARLQAEMRADRITYDNKYERKDIAVNP